MSEHSADDRCDDKGLWERVAQTVRKTPSTRLHHTQLVAAQTSRSSASVSKKAQKRTSHKAVSALRTDSGGQAQHSPSSQTPQIADLRSSHIAGIDRRNAKKMHAGKITLDATLDLHGLTQAEAHQRLISFVQSAVQNDYRMVLVITGKGRAGGGILRAKLPQWLRQAPLAPHINAIDHAVQRDGGTGAYYIRLRRRKGER